MALHISNDDEFEKKLKSEGFAEVLSEKTGYNKVSVKMIADGDGKDAAESLMNKAEKAKADLIVVLKENRNFFERIFKSSFTADLIKKVQLPVLVYRME
jgi:nucleotide-binding universal stress UspA family protein